MSLPMKCQSSVALPSRQSAFVAELSEAGHVADRCVQPHVEILAGRSGNFEAEVRRITADVPLLQAAVDPLGQLVGHRRHQNAAARPLAQEVGKFRQLEEIVLGGLQYRRGPGNRRARIEQVSGSVGRGADLAVVAVLVWRLALWAGALDEAVGEEQPFFRIVKLGDAAGGDPAVLLKLLVERCCQLAIFDGMRGVIDVEVDRKALEVTVVLLADAFDPVLGRHRRLLGAEHDAGAVGIVGADIVHRVPLHALEAHPDVCLDVAEQVAEMDGTVGVGQGVGDEDLTVLHLGSAGSDG
jgi:hypothetical protein